MLLDALRKHQCNPDTSCVVDITANMDDEDESNDEPSTPTTAIHDPADVQPRKHSLKLIKDVCTRWNSTFYMLQRCVLLKESIIHVLAESKYANLAPTDEQWLAAAKLCILLKPFQIATDFMQGEEYPTLGGISRYITTLIEGLQGSVPPPHWQLQSSWNSLTDAVKRVRSYILKDMKVRWDPADPLLGMAAIVHPGHKSLSWLCASDRDKIIRQLRNEMCNVEEQQQENESIDTDVSGEEEDEMELPSKIPRISPATSTSDDDFNLLFGQKKSQQQDNTAQKKVDKELDKYMKEDETDFRKDDPLLWWKEREMLYPLVAKLAKKYLAIPASTAPSERVFSVAKNILQKKRWNLLPSRLSKHIFLRKNSKLLV